MGARGPARKPTALKLLEGNPGHQKLNHNEPKPRPIAPDCPAWLNPIARREWRRICPELERLGLLTGVDLAGLANYCSLFAVIVQCEKAIHKTGLVVEIRDAAGTVTSTRQRAEVGVRHKAIMAIKPYLGEFGLTPAARGRMQMLGGVADAEEEESAFDI
jgi:P27 family predicted phage terminase small subunit